MSLYCSLGSCEVVTIGIFPFAKELVTEAPVNGYFELRACKDCGALSGEVVRDALTLAEEDERFEARIRERKEERKRKRWQWLTKLFRRKS
jgi:hypothetical protein